MSNKIIEDAFLETMESLERLHSALDTAHQAYAKNLREDGDRRPTTKADLAVRDSVAHLFTLVGLGENRATVYHCLNALP